MRKKQTEEIISVLMDALMALQEFNTGSNNIDEVISSIKQKIEELAPVEKTN